MHAFQAIAACAAFAVAAPTFAVDDVTATPVARTKHRHAAKGARASSKDESAAAGHPTATGNASFYSRRLAGKKTASGQRYDPDALTAAHRTLPLGTRVKVVNPKTDQSVVVTVNDRGPVPKNRVLDLSSAAAEKLGMKQDGVTKVETEVVAPAEQAGTGH